MSDGLGFDGVRELVHKVEDTAYEGIRKLTSMSTERVSEAELRERLASIRKCLVYRDGARDILDDCLAGNLDADHASHVLETIRYQAMALWGEDDEQA